MAIAVSILLHIILAGIVAIYILFEAVILAFLAPYLPDIEDIDPPKEKTVRLVLAKDQDEEKLAQEEPKPPPFMKTSPDQEAPDSPKDAPYIGARPTRAEGGPEAPKDMKEMPSQDGEKPRGDEIVLFDQSRQDGVLEHDRDGNPAIQSPPSQQQPQTDPSTAITMIRPGPVDPALVDGKVATPMIPQVDNNDMGEPREGPQNEDPSKIDDNTLAENTQDTAQDRETDKPPVDKELVETDTGSDGNTEGIEEEGREPEETTRNLLAAAIRNTAQFPDMMDNSRRIQLPAPGGASNEPNEQADLPLKAPQISPQLPAVSVLQPGAENAAPNKPKPLYDPAFTPETQPGFKTEERKTRTTGRFSFGRKAAMNVAATPMGRYEEIIYRAIGMCWYKQCDINRDLIVPGTLRIRILVDKKGKIADMRLMSRQGASTVQKSFTFVAIQQAPIPPMPPEVINDLIGDKLEMIFDFHF